MLPGSGGRGQESLDSKSYSQAPKKKGSEERGGLSVQGATCVKNAVAQLGPELSRPPASPWEGRDSLRSYLGTFQFKLYSFQGIAGIQGNRGYST